MRKFLILTALVCSASPALAEPKRDLGELQRVLRDPATIQKVQQSLGSLSDALLDLKVGGIQAALEGREATPAEQNLTVGDIERRKGPQAEAALRAQIAAAGPKVAEGMDALARALPAMTKAMDDIERVIERTAANMPDPNYPKR